MIISKKKFIFAFLLSFALVLQARAQLSSNRWLLVVDTSFSMSSCQPATIDAVKAMLLSGMNGQLHPGDTIGMWTYNDTLTTGKFPLQLWHPEVAQAIADRAARFVSTQACDKASRYVDVIPAVEHLVAISDILTIVFVTDGDEPIRGTPFDAPINAAFKKDFRYQKKARAPFIVALRAQAGKLVDYTITPAPWLASFPPLPPQAPVIAEEPKPEVKPEAPKPVVPSLILSGHKTETTNGTPPAPPPPPAPPITLAPPVVTMAPEPVNTNTQEIASLTVETQAIESAVSPAPPTETPGNIQPQTESSAPTTQSIEQVTLPSQPENVAVSPPEKLTTDNTPVIPETPKPPTVLATTPPSLPPEIKSEIAHLETNSDVTIHSAPQRPVPENVPPTSVTSTQSPAVVATTPPSTTSAQPPESGGRSKLVVGLLLLCVAAVLGIFLTRKSGKPSQGSLISQSLDKDKKNP